MIKYAYRGVDTGILRTKWHRRKTEATKDANKFIQSWLKIDTARPDAKDWIKICREETLELIVDEVF